MSTEPYVLSEAEVRDAINEYTWHCRSWRPEFANADGCEFDRFIAKIKADALRQAAGVWGDGREGFPYWFLRDRADRIEGGK